MMRPSLRKNNQMRPVSIETAVNKWAEGSCLVKIGGTQVLCIATVEFGQPTWKRMQNLSGGWITADYSMLPRANITRKSRKNLIEDHRSAEISRLIGRALRSVVDLEKLGHNTITIDCDVIQGDGGTRCASITGAFVAMVLAIRWLITQGRITESPVLEHIAATSVGIWNGEMILDLDYEEDHDAEMDSNFVVSESGKFIEIQATGEQKPFDKDKICEMMDMATTACKKLIDLQKQVLD